MKIFLFTLIGAFLLMSPNEAFAKKKNKGTDACSGVNCVADFNNPCCLEG